MSIAEKRTARRRAATVVATVLAFGFGGHLVSQRFDVQKTEEAYRAGAHELRNELASNETWKAAPEATRTEAGVKLVSFSNTATKEALLRGSQDIDRPLPAYRQAKALPASLAYADFTFAPEKSRDALTLASLAAYSAQNLNSAEREQTQLDCLAEAIYYEARSESLRGQLAVAEVVMNRVHDARFPKTVCGVVYQGHYRDTGCQFTFTCDGSLRNKPSGDAWDRARVIALHVSMGLAKPVTNKATHYHTDYVNPYWAAGLVETAVVGKHIFYRFPRTGPEWTTARLALDAQAATRPADPVDGFVPVQADVPVAAAPEAPTTAAALIPVAAPKPEEIAAAPPAVVVAAAGVAAAL
jgi:spore germination cell wall hydrolase CwlJ-like protein